MHVAIDGYTADTACLASTEAVYRFLDTCPEAIGMTKITRPVVITYRGPVPEDWGLSGFVIIAESHISVHTFPDRFFVHIDIFSCKPFDYGKAQALVQETFRLGTVKTWVLERGLEHYSAEEARRVLDMERSRLTLHPAP
ncbi:MAG: S-adenosylmethionine decarboxylase [Dehalococcoidia bacterium]|nr:S-adenosylmethionine decarboxylase [Dehalococcoidia bacterium]MDW8120190.1 S-adenosylmethionine decarboxylase [Chloroflexota bacterium]